MREHIARAATGGAVNQAMQSPNRGRGERPDPPPPGLCSGDWHPWRIGDAQPSRRTRAPRGRTYGKGEGPIAPAMGRVYLPIGCQLGPGLPRLPPPITVVPFISQITTSLLVFCHRMSE